MKDVKCSALRCTHNKSGLCNALVLSVRNGTASQPRHPHCASYAFYLAGANQSLLMEMGADMTVDRTNKYLDPVIVCQARDCIHNVNRECRASGITVEEDSVPRGKPACLKYHSN